MIDILTYTSLITGGFLILLMLLSLLGGLDLDFDVDADVEGDAGAGGLGIIKGGLTFISVTSWVIKLILVANMELWVAIAIGVISGVVAVWILTLLFKTLLRSQENVNWKITDAVYQEAQVYLRIPVGGSGIVTVAVNNVSRELKAKSSSKKEIKTGEVVLVTDTEGEYVIVEPVKRNEF